MPRQWGYSFEEHEASELGLQAAGEATEKAPMGPQSICGHLVLTEAELTREPRTVEVLWEFLHWARGVYQNTAPG